MLPVTACCGSLGNTSGFPPWHEHRVVVALQHVYVRQAHGGEVAELLDNLRERHDDPGVG